MDRECDACGRSYVARRATSRFCGGTCQKRAERARAAGTPLRAVPHDDLGAAPSELVQAVTRELEAVGRLGSVAGQIALVLARRIGSRRETGAATASLARELSTTMDKALGGVAQAADPLDEIRARRDRKRSAGNQQ